VYVDVLFISQLRYIGNYIERDYMILGSVNFCMHGGIVGIVSWFRAGGLWVYFGHILNSSAHASGILSEEGFFFFFSFNTPHMFKV
jgi:hypothetical protein